MKIELSISGQNLTLSHSFATATLVLAGTEEGIELDSIGEERDVVFSLGGDEANVELGKTDAIEDDTNPCWTKAFRFDYNPDETKFVTIGIHDVNEPDCPKGLGTFSLNELLDTKGNAQARETDVGLIIAHAAVPTITGTLHFQLRGKQLKNVEGFFWKSDPFFVIKRGGQELFISETVMNDLNPKWRKAEIKLSQLCSNGADLDSPFQVSVFDKEEDGNHDYMGSFQTTVNKLLSANPEDAIILTKAGSDAGRIFVVEAERDGVVDTSRNIEVGMGAAVELQKATKVLKRKEEVLKGLMEEVEVLDVEAKGLAEDAESKEASAKELTEEAEAAREAARVAAEEAEAAEESAKVAAEEAAKAEEEAAEAAEIAAAKAEEAKVKSEEATTKEEEAAAAKAEIEAATEKADAAEESARVAADEVTPATEAATAAAEEAAAKAEEAAAAKEEMEAAKAAVEEALASLESL